jgi:hypothetical protein
VSNSLSLALVQGSTFSTHIGGKLLGGNQQVQFNKENSKINK